MFKVTIMDLDEQQVLLELETEERALARAWYRMNEHNAVVVEVVETMADRPVTFKGLG